MPVSSILRTSRHRSLTETLDFPNRKFRPARCGIMLSLKGVKAQQQKQPTLWKCDYQRKTLFMFIYRNSRAFDGESGEREGKG